MSHDAPSTTPYGAGPLPAWSADHAPLAPATAPPLAGWWSRVGANVLDGLIDSAGYLVGAVVLTVTAEPAVDAVGDPTTVPSMLGGIVMLLGALLSLAVTMWNRFLRQGRTGQSVGKSVLDLRLVSTRTGAPIGAGLAFGRDVAHFLDGLFYLGYLWPLWDARKQTFADKIVGSVVVRAR